MRFFVLGPLEVETDEGDRHPIGSANQRILLAMLLSNPGTTISTDEFIDALWGDDPPPSALPSLRTYVSRLRKLVGNRLVSHDDGYSLHSADDDLDARAFEHDVGRGHFSDALQRWRGRPYGDVGDLPRVRADTIRLEALAATARAGQLDELLGLGRLAETVAAAEGVVVDDPVNEAAWAALVRALARSGRVADALRAYQRASNELAEAGLSPGADLRTAESEALSDPPARDTARRQIPPAPLTATVGLDADIDRLMELTERRRLVTIVGPGGVGKTRLALELGRRRADAHALGTRMVELSRISEPEAIEPTVRRALDLTEHDTGGPDGLGGVDALLVLDSCEHLIDAVAALVPTLLAGGDRLRILATSREPLRVSGEQRWALTPLPTSGDDAPALALFIDRARDVGAEIDTTNPLIRTIVSKLDGLPLAIEMAASRLATTSIEELADDLTRNIAALRTGHRDVAERHSTLRAVLEWSEALLTPEHRETLAEFSIFAGPVEADDLPAAVSAADPTPSVCSLADRSLVTVTKTEGTATLYGSLETVRHYGRERLVTDRRFDLVAERHARWFTDAAEEAAAVFDGVDQATAVKRIDSAIDELRAAHSWSRVNAPSLAVRISVALFQPALQGLRLEVFDWARVLADSITEDEPGAAEVFAVVASGLLLRGRSDESREWADRAIGTGESPAALRMTYTTLADAALYEGDLEQSLNYARQLDLLVEESCSHTECAYGKVSIALPLAYLGRHDEALAEIPEPTPGSSPTARGWLSYARGEVLLDLDTDAALRELDDAFALAESVDSHFLSGVAQVSAASARARSGNAEHAIGPLIATIARFGDRGNAMHLLTTLRNLPALFVRLEQWPATAELLGGLSTVDIAPTYGDEAERLAAAETAARSALGDEEFDRAHARGRDHDLDSIRRAAENVLTGLLRSAEG